MPGGSVAVAGPCGEVKPSKTKELQDWLDKEIHRVEEDIDILAAALYASPHASSRYTDLTSDEREVKSLKDQERFEDLKKYHEFLRLTKEAGIDIDAIERVMSVEVHSQYIKKNAGYLLKLTWTAKGEISTTIFDWQVGHLLEIKQYTPGNTSSWSAYFSWYGNAKISTMDYNLPEWIFSDNLAVKIYPDGSIRVRRI